VPAIVRLAHISDLHLADRSRYPRHGLTPESCAKHSTRPLEKLLAGLQEAGVDHLVVTGDLTMSGETTEFQSAARLLAPWSAAGKLTVLPGNHDVRSRAAAEQYRFLKYLGADGRGMKDPHATFPHRVELGAEVVLVALDSARWGADPEDTSGLVGPEQLQACRDAVRDAERLGRAVVVALDRRGGRRRCCAPGRRPASPPSRRAGRAPTSAASTPAGCATSRRWSRPSAWRPRGRHAHRASPAPRRVRRRRRSTRRSRRWGATRSRRSSTRRWCPTRPPRW
jgi:hypothetical protein